MVYESYHVSEDPKFHINSKYVHAGKGPSPWYLKRLPLPSPLLPIQALFWMLGFSGGRRPFIFLW
jgi:hypothetical protein